MQCQYNTTLYLLCHKGQLYFNLISGFILVFPILSPWLPNLFYLSPLAPRLRLLGFLLSCQFVVWSVSYLVCFMFSLCEYWSPLTAGIGSRHPWPGNWISGRKWMNWYCPVISFHSFHSYFFVLGSFLNSFFHPSWVIFGYLLEIVFGF